MKQIPFELAISPAQQDAKGKLGSLKIDNDNKLEQARCIVMKKVESGKFSEALEDAKSVIAAIENDKTIFDMVKAASCYQIYAWLLVREASYSPAIDCILKALEHLAGSENRSIEVKAMTAAMLYDYAIACHALNGKSKAEHALDKSIAMYREIHEADNDQRFFTAAIYVASAVAVIKKYRIGRLHTIDRIVTAIGNYQGTLPEGMTEAISDLIGCIEQEADAMQAVGRYRTAVRNYTKAIRLNMRISSEFNECNLRLSIKLAKALLFVPMRRIAAQKLLTSLKEYAESHNNKEAISTINRIEEREQLIQLNLLTYLRNIYS